MLRQPDRDLDRIAIFAAMGIADRYAAEQRLDGVVDVTLLDAEKLEPVLVDRQPQPWPLLADRNVDIDNERHFGEDFFDLPGDRPSRCRVRPVDFSEQGRKHRRPGRHLDDLDAGARGNADGLEALPEIERDVVAYALAIGACGKIDLQLAQLGSFTNIIVTHQAVEIERRRRAGVGLYRRD